LAFVTHIASGGAWQVPHGDPAGHMLASLGPHAKPGPQSEST
jgi:hypothetical protein